jgi:beta-glucanase (GH16 family)
LVLCVSQAIHAEESQDAAIVEPPLDLENYDVVFSEEFDKPLDVSPWGPNTRWIAHTPWRGDFGDAAFDNPAPDHPFTVKDGKLRIEARKQKHPKPGVRVWRSGLLASNDPKGDGFSLQYGYFEMSAKLPDTKGVWPAFWLSSSYDRTQPGAGADGSVEIDVLEYYGFGDSYRVTAHVWSPKPHRAEDRRALMPKRDAGTGFHTYGALVTPNKITFYRDRRAVAQLDTPKEHNKPLMILLNLGLGGGWPIDEVKDPSHMYVDYVRAYAKKSAK